MQVIVENNQVILYSDEGGRIAVLGQFFNTDKDIAKVVLRAIEIGKIEGKREVRRALGLI